MTPESPNSNLSDMLRVVPKHILPEGARERLHKLFGEMDQLLFLDRTNELAVDRKTLIRLVNTKEFIPDALRDIALVETSKYLGRRIKERADGRQISWRDAAKYGLPSYPMSEQDLRSWNVTENTSTDELVAILRSRLPDIPAFWMNDNPKLLAEAVVHNFQVNRTVWDCLAANLGWWAAITLLGGLAIFLILLGSGVPWPWALLIAGIYQTGATLYFLLQCAANPNFQQG
jgi:hypothetical protein